MGGLNDIGDLVSFIYLFVLLTQSYMKVLPWSVTMYNISVVDLEGGVGWGGGAPPFFAKI